MASPVLPILATAAAACAGPTFILAAIGKLRHRAALPATIADYRLLPPRLVAPAAMLLPWAEAAIGLGLLAGERPWAPRAAILLLGLFAAAMAINLRRGRAHIDCGCGGGGADRSLRPALVRRNLGLAAALLPAAIPLGGSVTGMAPPERALAVAAGLTAYILLRLLDALSALPGRPRPA